IIGNCPGCNLEVTFNDVKAGVENQHWTAGGEQKRMYDRRQISDVLAGGKHFYPDASNGGLGNDLVIEYSILWNETLLNLSPTYKDGARLLTTFDTTNGGFSGDYRAIAYASLTDNVKDSGAKFAGAFEFPSNLIRISEPGDPHPGMIANGGAYSAYANLGGTDRDHPEWGWHRVGVVYHEDVTNLAAVRDNGADATYKLTVTIYIDGEVVSILSGTNLDRNSADYKLFTATHDGNGGVTYEDIDEDVWVFAFLVPYVTAPTADAWFADGDVFVTAGHDFVHPVTRIDHPAPRTETVDGHDFSGAFYYTSAGAHEHGWGNWNQISEATSLLDPGIDRRYCSICGMNDDREIPLTHNVQKFTTSSSGSYSPNRATVGTIRGSEHFYTPGNDLLVEYSVLWTEGITNLRHDSGSYRPYMDSRFAQDEEGKPTNKNIIYWSLTDNVNGSDCKFAGGFEWGGCDQNENDNPYPKFTASVWDAEKKEYVTGDEITEFPNIGGLNGGDGTEQGNDRYGWHRVSIRYRQEVSNVDAVKANSAAEYKLSLWVYIDGVLVVHSYATDFVYHPGKNDERDYKLFTAASDGNGGITYTDINDDLYFHGAFLNSTEMASGTAYFEIADYSATIGSDFVQNVRRVNDPTPTTLEVENGVFVPSTMWYELAD
ncbi:MAG: hypothetical protein IKP74_05940, partial [Clostridia bacterium]|nr:hypothetical protein [Clostridia bacterium]